MFRSMKFKKTGKVFILITLKDGKEISGKFGANSFVSSASSQRDIYLEEVWDKKPGKKWEKNGKIDKHR